MVRAITAKTVRTLNKGEQALLLPAAGGPEPWQSWVINARKQAECVQSCATPADNRLQKNSVLALPVAQVFCLPLWLNETDRKLFPGMISLQLESRSLQTRRNAAPIFDWSVVTQVETRTLVLVGILPGLLPEELQAEAYPAFDLSARCLPLPENAIAIWLEQDYLVVAITRESELVYFQRLAENRLTQRVLQELICIRSTLEMQEVLAPLREIVLWTEAFPSEIDPLKSALQLPVRQADKPVPHLPATPWKLTPGTVDEAKKTRLTRRWQLRAGLVALAVYLVLVAWMLGRLYLTSRHVDELRHWQADHAQALELVHTTQAAWKDLSPVVDEETYPLEQLLHCTESMPGDGLHLTLFEQNNTHILIKGEAKNAAEAFQFIDKLKGNAHFKNYTWEMGQPRLLPNDLAQLQIEGNRATTTN